MLQYTTKQSNNIRTNNIKVIVVICSISTELDEKGVNAVKLS